MGDYSELLDAIQTASAALANLQKETVTAASRKGIKYSPKTGTSRKTICYKCPAHLYALIREESRRRGISVTETITQAVQAYLSGESRE
jgi:hypothetical protein